MPFVELDTKQQLDEFLAGRNGAPAILFKHSNTCGISSQAYREMARVDQPVGIITVQKARDVSDEIERRFAVAHETPQALIVRSDELLWNASHSSVRAQAVEEALTKVSSKQ
jgi:bacillithiol system protein YtxJ